MGWPNMVSEAKRRKLSEKTSDVSLDDQGWPEIVSSTKSDGSLPHEADKLAKGAFSNAGRSLRTTLKRPSSKNKVFQTDSCGKANTEKS